MSTSPTPATSTTSSTTPSATPAPSQSVSPPGATQSPLPPLPPSRASNGWIAYSTDGQNPGSTDVTTGSDIYLVREGGEPRLIAGREGGTTRNVCPAFSPDGRMLAYGVASPPGRAVVVVGVDANGVIPDAVEDLSGRPRGAWWFPDPGQPCAPGGRPTARAWPISTARPWTFADSMVRRWPPPLATPASRTLTWAGPERSAPLAVGRSGSRRPSACQIVVSRPGGTAAHAIALADCGYAIAAWSPDGRQVLLLQEVSSADFALQAIGVDSTSDVTIVSTVRTNGARSEPGRGDVSWQPVFP